MCPKFGFECFFVCVCVFFLKNAIHIPACDNYHHIRTYMLIFNFPQKEHVWWTWKIMFVLKGSVASVSFFFRLSRYVILFYDSLIFTYLTILSGNARIGLAEQQDDLQHMQLVIKMKSFSVINSYRPSKFPQIWVAFLPAGLMLVWAWPYKCIFYHDDLIMAVYKEQSCVALLAAVGH